jgi:DNA-directed RNA polymerase alpha subunit
MGVDADNARYEREQYEAETAYGKQQDAYERLISLITTTGYTPSAQELQAAGMSQAQAKAYADYYTKQNTKVGTPYQAPANPQPKPEPEPQPQPKPNIEKDLNDVIAGGATKSEINSALRDELKKGNITQAEYNRLKNQYAPRGYTY